MISTFILLGWIIIYVISIIIVGRVVGIHVLRAGPVVRVVIRVVGTGMPGQVIHVHVNVFVTGQVHRVDRLVASVIGVGARDIGVANRVGVIVGSRIARTVGVRAKDIGVVGRCRGVARWCRGVAARMLFRLVDVVVHRYSAHGAVVVDYIGWGK